MFLSSIYQIRKQDIRIFMTILDQNLQVYCLLIDNQKIRY